MSIYSISPSFPGHTEGSSSCSHLQKESRMSKRVVERISFLEKALQWECDGNGGRELGPEIGVESIRELNELKTLNESCPVLEAHIALDIHAKDHNGSIKKGVISALKSGEIVLTTQSMLCGAGSENLERLSQLRNGLQKRKKEYHFFIDQESQYVLMVPKELTEQTESKEILKNFDFSPSRWLPCDATTLLETSYVEPQFEHLLSLFSAEPIAKKRIVLHGHGGDDTLCSLTKGEYLEFYDLLGSQKTEFLYVSSCGSGSKKGWQKRKSSGAKSFITVLGTYTGESQYGGNVKKDFFSTLDIILSRGKVHSSVPFRRLFDTQVEDKRNTRLIRLAEEGGEVQPFLLVRSSREDKDLRQTDISVAQIERRPIELTKKKTVCLHPSHIPVPMKVSPETVIFPYESETLTVLHSLDIDGGTPEEYFSFLKEYYQQIDGQSAQLLFQDLEGKTNVLWLLSKNGSIFQTLSETNISEALELREKLNVEIFRDKILPRLNAEVISQLALLDQITVKGGADLTSKEMKFFRSHLNVCLEELVKRGTLVPELLAKFIGNKAVMSILLEYCIQYNRMELLPELKQIRPAISKRHFLAAMKHGNIAALRKLDSVSSELYPENVIDFLLPALEGGEEMFIEIYKRLDLPSDLPCLNRANLFKLTVEIGWEKLALVMLEESGKPKSTTAHIEDDPLNLLIDAAHKDKKWTPHLTLAIQKGWNPVDQEPLGHKNLPLNQLIRRGMFEHFLLLLGQYDQDNLKRFTRYLPLSAAIDQRDMRFLEVLLSLNVFSVNAEVSPGLTLPSKAVKVGNLIAVQLLIENHAAVNPISPWQDSPLSIALRSKNLEMVKLLISNLATEVTKGDIPHVIDVIKEFDDEECVWRLLFLAYRKPSLYEPLLSKELFDYFLSKGMKAQVQWILSRRDQYQTNNKEYYLEKLVQAQDWKTVEDLLNVYSPLNNKYLILRLIKQTPQDTFEGIMIREALFKELKQPYKSA